MVRFIELSDCIINLDLITEVRLLAPPRRPAACSDARRPPCGEPVRVVFGRSERAIDLAGEDAEKLLWAVRHDDDPSAHPDLRSH